MKKKYVLISVFLVAVLAMFNVKTVNSEIPFPPAGSAGGPENSNKTCAQSGCHPGSNGGTVATTTELTLNIDGSPLTSSFKYAGGTEYTIDFNIEVPAANNPYYGFQIISLNSANAQAGTFTATNTTNTVIKTVLNRDYMGHKGANSNKTWSFKWTAPASSTGDITFYYSFNVAEAGGSTPPTNPIGTIYKGTVTVQNDGVGMNDIAGKMNSFNIFPSPVNNTMQLSFNLNKSAAVEAELYTLNGQKVKSLLNENVNAGIYADDFNVSDIAPGIYLVKLNVEGTSVIRKIVKE